LANYNGDKAHAKAAISRGMKADMSRSDCEASEDSRGSLALWRAAYDQAGFVRFWYVAWLIFLIEDEEIEAIRGSWFNKKRENDHAIMENLFGFNSRRRLREKRQENE